MVGDNVTVAVGLNLLPDKWAKLVGGLFQLARAMDGDCRRGLVVWSTCDGARTWMTAMEALGLDPVVTIASEIDHKVRLSWETCLSYRTRRRHICVKRLMVKDMLLLAIWSILSAMEAMPTTKIRCCPYNGAHLILGTPPRQQIMGLYKDGVLGWAGKTSVSIQSHDLAALTLQTHLPDTAIVLPVNENGDYMTRMTHMVGHYDCLMGFRSVTRDMQMYSMRTRKRRYGTPGAPLADAWVSLGRVAIGQYAIIIIEEGVDFFLHYMADRPKCLQKACA